VAGTTYDPARLALWTELHEKVATLNDQERTVFEMHFYLELPQAEIARVLELHPPWSFPLLARSKDRPQMPVLI
jgi:hypothetical protein